ncbi:FecR family protein [Aestuariivivens sediminis]|uniref:FecR family protein n=1 Tax=Aestuariivivens sediminis TaxID=2913557 RepID=UPI001F575477|nr:FecR family protein [Aestuariivivens sediminis]
MMNREKLISKWLDNNLNDQELQAFKALEDHDDLVRLNTHLQRFKADDYEVSEELHHVLTNIRREPQKPRMHWLKPIMRVAAVLAICFSLYYYTTTLDTTISTDIAEKSMVELPDASHVILNAKSTLVFNKKNWKKVRDVELKGEAFFKVSKGSSFNVLTASGSVTVYGTQFNVKQRNNYFEVICYEGLVGVTYKSHETKLRPGDSFLIIDGEIIAKEKENLTTPSWLNNESLFNSIPYKVVIAEFERQYHVDFTLLGVDSTQLFTGGFSHDNIDVALQSITLPLHLTYSKENNSIILRGD